MTDKEYEIFMQLVYCKNMHTVCGKKHCPYGEHKDCIGSLMQDIVNIIYRQQQEIERLNKENKILVYRSDVLTLSNRQKENTIAELTEKITEKMKELCKEVLRLACTDIDVFLSEPEVRLIDANEAEKLMVKMLGAIYGE